MLEDLRSIYEMPPEVYEDYISMKIEERNFEKVFDIITKKRDIHRPLRILDLCCGTGHFADKYLSVISIDSYFGVDMNEDFLKYAKRRFMDRPNFNFFLNDAVTADINEKNFDFVITTSGYHHIEDERKVDFLKNGANHLDEKGYFLIYEKLILPFEDRAGAITSSVSFYNQRILDIIKEQELNDNQMCSLLIEMCLSAFRIGEFKVSSERFFKDIDSSGLHINDAVKLWPDKDIFNNDRVGDFVFTLKKFGGAH